MEFLVLAVVFIAGLSIGLYQRGYCTENVGERTVRKLLTTSFPSDEYHLMNNVTLPTSSGTTQVDHILVSTKGIFVIETKHYSGWIFANAKAKKWTQVIYKSKKSFQNPIHQNYAHLKAVQSLLDFLEPKTVKSAVVFTGEAEFKTERPEGVFDLKGFEAEIQSYTENVLSRNRVQFCVGRLECTRYRLSKETDIQHMQNLAKRGRSSL